jgi:hypothetical protein
LSSEKHNIFISSLPFYGHIAQGREARQKTVKKNEKIFEKPLDKYPALWYNMQAL